MNPHITTPAQWLRERKARRAYRAQIKAIVRAMIVRERMYAMLMEGHVS